VITWLTAHGLRRGRIVEYSLGWPIGEAERPPSPAYRPRRGRRRWTPTALTGLLDLGGWPAGMRVIVRRERPHPGAQLSLFEEHDGWRYTAFVTNTQVGAPQWLEAGRHAHARVEDRSRCAKDTGLGRLPSREFAINAAWCTAATHRRRPHRPAADPRTRRRPRPG
jgi:hypothetical protein